MSGEFGVFYGENLYRGAVEKDPIIEHLIYDRDVVCLIADPGVGKSILALQLLFSLTAGHPFLETYLIRKKCSVLYLQTEGDRAETIERINAMKKQYGVDDTKWAHLNLPGIHLNTPEGLNKFVAYANQSGMKYDVIIIDPLYTTVKGSMTSDEVATDWVRNLRTIREVYGCAFVILHHDNKEQRSQDGEIIPRNKNAVFGSIFWGAFFNSTFKLHIKANGHRMLAGGKQRSGNIVDGIELELMQPYPLYYKQVVEGDYGMSKSKIYDCVIKNKICSAWLVIKETQLSKATVYRSLRSLCTDQRLMRLTGGLYMQYDSKADPEDLEGVENAKEETPSV